MLSPQIKMVYSGHRNLRTIVSCFKPFILKLAIKSLNIQLRLKIVHFGAQNLYVQVK